MKKHYKNAALLLLIVLVAGFAALTIGQRIINNEQFEDDVAHVDMHSILHVQLGITGESNLELAAIENRYNQKRRELETTIKEANRELAEAILGSPEFSPEVQQVIYKIHTAMGELQSATVEHLYEMQTVLTTEQNQKLQQLITDALNENASSGN